MIKISSNNTVSATEAVRNFSSILKRVSIEGESHVVIVKNNRLEAVVLSIEEYEKLIKAYDILQEIYNKKR